MTDKKENFFYLIYMQIQSSTSAIQASFQRMDASAHNVANVNTPGFSTDLAKERVEQIKSEKELAANASVIKTQDKMQSELVNLLV